MTSDELREYFNKTYGLRESWVKQHKVDAVTYANVCQDIFNYHIMKYPRTNGEIHIKLGSNNGIMFKGVELILER